MMRIIAIGWICLIVSLYPLVLEIAAYQNGSSFLNLTGIGFVLRNEELMHFSKLHVLVLLLAFASVPIMTIISLAGSALMLILRNQRGYLRTTLMWAMPILVGWQVIALELARNF